MISMMAFSTVSFAQRLAVSGTIVDETGDAVPGVNVLEKGTANGTSSDAEGKYSINVADGNAILVFSFIGFKTEEVSVGSRSAINITLTADATSLEEVVVTGYSEQRKKDITGAVTVVKVDELKTLAASNFGTQLAGRAAGVTTSTSGAPGDGVNIRIRGFSSLGRGGSDPLIIIDGVQIQGDKAMTGLNPNDIASVQVLKDASSASIYGARANAGVIIITTKQGTPGKVKVSYDGYVGRQTPVEGYDKFLMQSPVDYAEVEYREAAASPTFNGNYRPLYGGTSTFQMPNFIYPVKADNSPYATLAEIEAAKGPYSYPNNLIIPSNPSGTNWWDEVFGPAYITSHDIGISGGTEASTFNISAGYFKQDGTMNHTGFERFSMRANSQFTAGKFRFGESISLARTSRVDQPGGNQQEGNVMTNIIKEQPIVPVRDIAGGAGNGKSTGLGNATNPVVWLERNKNNATVQNLVLANFFGQFNFTEYLYAKTSFSVDYRTQFFQNFVFPTFENAEPSTTNSFFEQNQNTTNWVFTNTLNFDKSIGKGNLKILAGYEAYKSDFRNLQGQLSGYVTTDLDARFLNVGLGDLASRQVQSNGAVNTISSVFGKIDYEYDDRYIVSVTARRDGSSNFGEDKRYGVFPAVSVGWRITSESFMPQTTWLDELKIRAGYGVTGNQNAQAGNAYQQYSGSPASTAYDITGANTGVRPGFTLTQRGNALTEWEENKSTNIGLDVVLFSGKLSAVFDWYTRNIEGLLIQATLPGTAGAATPAFTNVASMENNGWDLALNWRSQINNSVGLTLGLNLTHYKNKITNIDGGSNSFFPVGIDSRFGLVNINQLNYPISSFYGFQTDGIFQDAADVAGHATQDGAAPGRMKFKDITGDGIVDNADRGPTGSPHPDLTLGFNIGLDYKQFDFTMFLYGSFGNEIFNYNKIFHDFRLFNTNVRTNVLTDSWTPENTGASIPRLDASDSYSRVPSDYYVESGSFLRARTVSIGYNITPSKSIGFSKLRVYIQGQNLFTITDYSGIDPDLSNVNVGQADGQGRKNNDQWTGFDFGNYPSSRVYMIGVNATF